MTVNFNNVPPETKILELGGGDNPHPASTCNVDVRKSDKVHFTVNFEEPNWPINSNEWDVVFSQYALEHVSYPKIPQFLREVYRILKPGAKAVILTANTEAQLEWVREHKDGWDNEDFFTSASKKLFGGQDYNENAHKSFFSPTIVMKLFQEAGFEDIQVLPYGARQTDLAIEATKPANFGASGAVPSGFIEVTGKIADTPLIVPPQEVRPNIIGTNVEPTPLPPERPPPEQLFDRYYFDGGSKVGGYQPPGYLDFPCHEVTVRHVLARRPESVLELGCARGYVLKRIQDAGMLAAGFDVSKHCSMTRAADNLHLKDLRETPWWQDGHHFDLCFSIAFWEHVPEENLPIMIKEMERTCTRGLHGITFQSDGSDKTQVTLKPKEWWRERLPKSHEILDKRELESGPLPPEVLAGDGKVKVAIGGFTTMYHHGWTNLDAHDLDSYAQPNGYRYQRHDIRNGLPFGTGTVDLIYLPMFLQRLEYLQGLAILRECRRVLKADGAMRLSIPDLGLLAELYCKIPDDARSIYLGEFDHINENCANAPTDAGKLWSLLFAGHQMAYDYETVEKILKDAGFTAQRVGFRQGQAQVLRETLDLLPCFGLYVDVQPAVS